ASEHLRDRGRSPIVAWPLPGHTRRARCGRARSRAADRGAVARAQASRTRAEAGEIPFAAAARTARQRVARNRRRHAHVPRDARRATCGAGNVRVRGGDTRSRAMSTAWKERHELGNTFWLRVIVGIARLCGRTVAQACMWPTAAYFFV